MSCTLPNKIFNWHKPILVWLYRISKINWEIKKPIQIYTLINLKGSIKVNSWFLAIRIYKLRSDYLIII